MVFGPFDYRPNVNIPPDVFTSLANRYSGGYNAFTEQYDKAQQKAMERAKQTKWQQAISDLMQNPDVPQNVKMFAPLIGQYPELAGQIMPELLKTQKPGAIKPLSGFTSEKGTILEYDPTGKIIDTGVKGKSTGYGATMGPLRQRQYTLMDLPSNQGPSTSGGAAYQVKLGARQGKALIAKAGSPQRTGAARADLVRSITRVAPTDEGLRNVNFSSNLSQRWSELKQMLTTDPTAVDNPKIRREMYDIFTDMEKSSEPFITNQLDEMSDQGFNITPATRRRQLGLNFPDIPFEESPTNNLGKGLTQGTTTQGGWSYVGTAP